MSASSQESYQVINLFDWTGGIRNNRSNPLSYPANCLMWGENVDLVNRGLETRRGYELMGTLPDQSGMSGGTGAACEVRGLAQVRFPSAKKSYLIAQAEDSSGHNRLYACLDELPVSSGSGSWTEIYDLSSGAGVVSITTLNDRAIITEGQKNPPLVFAGCMDPSGSDWAVPRAAFVTYNSGVDQHDITAAVCDGDPETFEDISYLDANSGWVSVCVDMPGVVGFRFDMESGNSQSGELIVQGYSGAWGSGSGWLDSTSGLSKDGIVIHSGGIFSAAYHVENSLPGYWFRFRWASGTAGNVLVQRILFQAPCQRLQVIGDSRPDLVLGMLYWDESEKTAKDFTSEVSDAASSTFARLNDGASDNPVGMGSADALYVGYPTRFEAVEVVLHNDYNNKNSAAMSGSYWTGTQWAGLIGFKDSTQEPVGKTLGKKGKIEWVIPSNWKQNRPISAQFAQGYWVRLKVSSNLTPKTYLSEVGIWPVLDPLKKIKLAVTVRDRIVLCNRSDAPNRVEISRRLEQYGFAGTDSSSLSIGGQGEIVAAIEAFNQGFIAKSDDWYLLNGNSPQTFSVERSEAAGQAPINNRVVVRAPHTEPDMKNLMGLYYINMAGAWYFSGQKLYQISQDVSWWDPATDASRLDLDDLFRACGLYWPEKNWVMWSVPMIVDGTRQAFNNRLMIYDLTLKTWLPLFTISLASLASASHHNPAAPGKLGPVGIYGGDYQGRIVRLFGSARTDLGQAIEGWVETGWLNFGSPECSKLLRGVTIFGKTAGSRITIQVYSDGETSSPALLNYQDLSGPGSKLFATGQLPENIRGRFFKFRISFTDVTSVYGLQIATSIIREWGSL